MTEEGGRLSATPSMIARYIEAEYGLKYAVNALWQSLQRLVARGLACRLPGGRGHYSLALFWSEWFVENFVPRNRGKPL